MLYGHRGASLHAPENTLAAFTLAADWVADGIELDAKLTLDGYVVVIHDPTVDRTTNGTGAVRDLTLQDLRKLDAGLKFASKYKGEKIPLLDEVFEAVGKKMLINVELTNYANPGDKLPEKVAELIKKHGIGSNILFSSFHPITLSRIRRLLPDIPAGLLVLPGGAGTLSRSFLGRWFSPQLIHPYYSDVNSAFVTKERRWGRKINVWTVDEQPEMIRLMELGVDGIITDDIPLAIQTRKNFSR
jgi:glycerophosphoryl diester phosphodiesterase